jgi:hypothetical protein
LFAASRLSSGHFLTLNSFPCSTYHLQPRFRNSSEPIYKAGSFPGSVKWDAHNIEPGVRNLKHLDNHGAAVSSQAHAAIALQDRGCRAISTSHISTVGHEAENVIGDV